MAKTKKKEKIVDLKAKPEKITPAQLEKIQKNINGINRAQLELGSMEIKKHEMMHNIAGLRDNLATMQNDFMKEYGTYDIDIVTGKINYSEDGEVNKED